MTTTMTTMEIKRGVMEQLNEKILNLIEIPLQFQKINLKTIDWNEVIKGEIPKTMFNCITDEEYEKEIACFGKREVDKNKLMTTMEATNKFHKFPSGFKREKIFDGDGITYKIRAIVETVTFCYARGECLQEDCSSVVLQCFNPQYKPQVNSGLLYFSATFCISFFDVKLEYGVEINEEFPPVDVDLNKLVTDEMAKRKGVSYVLLNHPEYYTIDKDEYQWKAENKAIKIGGDAILHQLNFIDHNEETFTFHLKKDKMRKIFSIVLYVTPKIEHIYYVPQSTVFQETPQIVKYDTYYTNRLEEPPLKYNKDRLDREGIYYDKNTREKILIRYLPMASEHINQSIYDSNVRLFPFEKGSTKWYYYNEFPTMTRLLEKNEQFQINVVDIQPFSIQYYTSDILLTSLIEKNKNQDTFRSIFLALQRNWRNVWKKFEKASNGNVFDFTRKIWGFFDELSKYPSLVFLAQHFIKTYFSWYGCVQFDDKKGAPKTGTYFLYWTRGESFKKTQQRREYVGEVGVEKVYEKLHNVSGNERDLIYILLNEDYVQYQLMKIAYFIECPEGENKHTVKCMLNYTEGTKLNFTNTTKNEENESWRRLLFEIQYKEKDGKVINKTRYWKIKNWKGELKILFENALGYYSIVLSEDNVRNSLFSTPSIPNKFNVQLIFKFPASLNEKYVFHIHCLEIYVFEFVNTINIQRMSNESKKLDLRDYFGVEVDVNLLKVKLIESQRFELFTMPSVIAQLPLLIFTPGQSKYQDGLYLVSYNNSQYIKVKLESTYFDLRSQKQFDPNRSRVFNEIHWEIYNDSTQRIERWAGTCDDSNEYPNYYDLYNYIGADNVEYSNSTLLINPNWDKIKFNLYSKIGSCLMAFEDLARDIHMKIQLIFIELQKIEVSNVKDSTEPQFSDAWMKIQELLKLEDKFNQLQQFPSQTPKMRFSRERKMLFLTPVRPVHYNGVFYFWKSKNSVSPKLTIQNILDNWKKYKIENKNTILLD